MILKLPVLATFALIVLGWLAAPVSAAPTEEQRREIQALKVEIRKASNFLRRGRVAESAALVKEIQARIDTLASGGAGDIIPQLEQLVESLVPAHGLLEVEGYTLKPLPGHRANAAAAMTAPASMPPTPPPSAPAPSGLPETFPETNISFTRHVAPILIARCGNCHVTGSRGGFSASSYAMLMQGPPEGVVIFPNDDVGSRLIETIETGDMPRGGGQVRDVELAALKTWVREGARFDGPNQQAPLTQLAPMAETAQAPRLEVTPVSGNETVSFSRDIAGVLANRCVSCHSGNNPRGNLSIESFARLIRGGDSGAPFIPGRPQDSTLVRLLKAPAPDRMPRNGPPLSDEEIGKIETWIREGGRFDGESPQVSMQRLNNVALAKVASAEELAQMRVESSQLKWNLGMPNVESAKVDTPEFLAYGTMGEAALQKNVEEAQKAADRVRSILKIPASTPLVKGKMTLYFFKQRYDYAEFGNMVERREVPGNWRGHWWYDITDAYAAIQEPSGEEYALDVLLAQQIASAHVASLGNGSVPRWFSEGVGRVVASRLGTKDPRVNNWDSALESAIAGMNRPDDFVNNRLPPEENALVSYGFAKAMMGRGGSFDALLTSMRQGTSFDQAFQKAFNMPPDQLAAAWINSGRR